jgi:hypothetical protein
VRIAGFGIVVKLMVYHLSGDGPDDVHRALMARPPFGKFNDREGNMATRNTFDTVLL